MQTTVSYLKHTIRLESAPVEVGQTRQQLLN